MDLDQKAIELGEHVQKFLREFQTLHCSAADGLHVGLSQQELRLVEFLGRDGSQIMRAIADYLHLAVNSVTTLVDGMELKRLVVRSRSTEDRRVVLVELTASGQDVWREFEQAKRDLYRSMLKSLNPREQDQFLDLFRKIAHASSETLTVASR